MRFQHLKRWMHSASDALGSGADQPSALTVHWDVSGKGTRYACTSPVHFEHKGTRCRKRFADYSRERGAAMTLELEARCRKCEPCLRARAAMWRIRAQDEIQRSVRTWFGTLTLSPDQHYVALCRASRSLRKRGQRFEELSPAAQFAARCNAIAPEITKYLKRLRFESGASLRYILVAERHKSGLPHFHALVHECDPAAPVRKRVLKDQWKLGFSDWRLAEPAAAGYVAKYLSKSAEARVRASQQYGKKIDSTVTYPLPRHALSA